jgi:hypothetical protein
MIAESTAGERHPRKGRRVRSTHSPARPPDLAVTAQQAVVRFLHDAAAAPDAGPGPAVSGLTGTDGTAGAGTTVAVLDERPGPAAAGTGAGLNVAAGPAPAGGADAAGSSAESVAVHAAARSVATLDKIESMAAKLETDIAFALQAQAELQAGAGVAAAAAVKAAQESWRAAVKSAEAESHVRDHLRVIGRNLVFTAVLALIAIIILALFTVSVH